MGGGWEDMQFLLETIEDGSFHPNNKLLNIELDESNGLDLCFPKIEVTCHHKHIWEWLLRPKDQSSSWSNGGEKVLIIHEGRCPMVNFDTMRKIVMLDF